MNSITLFCLSGFDLRLRSNEFALLRAILLLSGRKGLFFLKGMGASQCPLGVCLNPVSIVLRNLLSSIDKPGFSSPGTRSKIGSSFTMSSLSHGCKYVGLPLANTDVLLTLTCSGRCARPKHTSPITTHPRGNFWPNGSQSPSIR
ncbi:hypothetical protein CI610_03337 [invertebrate metagenome]|uniref:Uncharacterized protein n=1 Tax=invertebrate metagenome TaxID=1711999 RepID=A0A2H9T3C5_9ZZZZ